MVPLLAAITYNAPQFAVGWGTLSLINAGLAQSKGQSGLFWWFVSLLLGPFATFLIVAFVQPLPPHAFGNGASKPPIDGELH